MKNNRVPGPLNTAAFARLRGVAPRQVRRWLAAGMPGTGTTPARVPVKAADAWLEAQAVGRGRSGREIADVLTHRAGELLQKLTDLVHAHVPADVAAAWWAAHVHEVSARLRAWPPLAAPALLARCRGEVTAPPADRRLTAASVAMLTRAPTSPIALALATQEAAGAYLEPLAATPLATDARLERRIAAARAHVLAGLKEVGHPRARIATTRARIDAFKLGIRRGQWERSAVVEARAVAATTAARQMLLESAPRLVMQVFQPATAPAMTFALATAVETALYELTRGRRDPADATKEQ